MSKTRTLPPRPRRETEFERLVDRGPAFVVLTIGMLFIPLFYIGGMMNIETVNMLGRYMAFAIVALGLDLIWGYTGVLSLCQSFFFAVGGYTMGMYLSHQGTLFNGIPESLYVVYPYGINEARGDEVLPWFWMPLKYFPLTLILGLLVPGLLAYIIGRAGFYSRVRGVYFAILTQAITVAATMFFSKNEMKLCGTNGLTHFKTIIGFDLTEPAVKLGLYYTTLLALIGAYLLCRGIVRSRFGRILVAIRDDESTLRFSGYSPAAYKLFVFTVAGALAGLAGMLYVPQANIITPSYMEAKWSIMMVVWVAVGGRGTLSGAVLGTLVINLLYNYFTSQRDLGPLVWKPEYWQFVLGGMFIGVVMLFPNGLLNIWLRLIGKEVKA